jgi:indolepyruvate ferredoxin oxidoreductase
MSQQIREAVAEDANCAFVDANGLTTALLGDAIYTNPFVLGHAWQKGWIPLAYESLTRAIELNGVAIETNKRAFEWGRAAAHDLDAVKKAAFPAQVIELKRVASSLEDIVAKRVEYLTGYQNASYAKRYADLVERVRRVESDRFGGSTKLAEAVARYYFKLLAYKDEYEVARLHLESTLPAALAAEYPDGVSIQYNLHPPLLRALGFHGKIKFGRWFDVVFRALRGLRGLRGGALDPFGWPEVRRVERALVGEYRALVDKVLVGLDAASHARAVKLAGLPDVIRGYEDVKLANVRRFRDDVRALGF